LSDLAAFSPTMTIAGPSECPTRRFCTAGLRDVYGIAFKGFQPYDSEQERLTALREGLADVAVVFTTNASLAGDELLLLGDDRRLQPAENVVPVVSDRVLARYRALSKTLDAVSAQLSSAVLTFLNWRVQIAGKPVPAEAGRWLDRHGL
jgi:glycine betaine/choline ABC-type transport system substrate-binding protein